MAWVDVRRLAAADMWGTAGTIRRRRMIRAEFVVGVFGCLAFGVLSLASGTGWIKVIGVWLIGTGVNYIPLAVHAQALSPPGALEAEFEGVDMQRELRRAGVKQLWIAVPFVVALAAIADYARRWDARIQACSIGSADGLGVRVCVMTRGWRRGRR